MPCQSCFIAYALYSSDHPMYNSTTNQCGAHSGSAHSQLAKKYLSSSASERLFSSAGNIITGQETV